MSCMEIGLALNHCCIRQVLTLTSDTEALQGARGSSLLYLKWGTLVNTLPAVLPKLYSCWSKQNPDKKILSPWLLYQLCPTPPHQVRRSPGFCLGSSILLYVYLITSISLPSFTIFCWSMLWLSFAWCHRVDWRIRSIAITDAIVVAVVVKMGIISSQCSLSTDSSWSKPYGSREGTLS